MDKREALKVLNDALEACEMKCGGAHLVVLDRGWIFHGNLVTPEEPNGDYVLTNCVNVRKWSENGFGGLTKGAVFSGATLDDCNTIRFKERSLIFLSPTSEGWRKK